MIQRFHPNDRPSTPYLFFTGKGGVGKTSTACATAVALADSGKRVLLVSTDPASNLQDVFGMALSNSPSPIEGVPYLFAANLDPETAAAAYKDQVVGPYRGLLPERAITTMEEQLSGACTVEIAAFNEFSALLTDTAIRNQYDHIVFDTAPTGHTLRLLQLPTAWSGFLSESTHGASCLGPLAGLEAKKKEYEEAVQTLSDPKETTLVLVTRPEESPLKEAARASEELRAIGVQNQILIINGLHASYRQEDVVSNAFHNRQQSALVGMSDSIKRLPTYQIPLAPFNVTGLSKLRRFFDSTSKTDVMPHKELVSQVDATLYTLLNDLEEKNIRVIFTMGKGGVGKTSVASAIAVGLAERGKRVHLSTTDPAAHIGHTLERGHANLTVSRIDPVEELKIYKDEVLLFNKDMLDADGLAYLEEDLKSPCTEEIAVFRAFAALVERSKDEIVVVDTAPTGHTLLLLHATADYHRELARSSGGVPEAVQRLLPRLRDPEETSVVIVTLAEATPYYEAARLEADLKRAEIPTKWWVINQSLHATKTADPILRGRAQAEQEWVSNIQKTSKHHSILIAWDPAGAVGYDQLKKWSTDPST